MISLALSVLLMISMAGCASGPRAGASAAEPGDPGARYVRLALALDAATQGGYVFAYRGPEEVKAEAVGANQSVDAIAHEVRALIADIGATDASGIEAERLDALRFRLEAMLARIDVLQGKDLDFTTEAQRIFGVRPPRYSVDEADSALEAIARLLPGDGSLAERAEAFNAKLRVPEHRQEAVIRRALEACRAKTAEHLELPEDEQVELVLVDRLEASARYDYLGGYKGRITLNRQDIDVGNAIPLGCHEGYPGHHLRAILRDERFGGRDWPELELETLFEPSPLISEGLGQYAVDLAFSDEEHERLLLEELLPLAGLDPGDAERIVALRRALKPATRYWSVEVPRAYLDGEISREEAIDLIAKYSLRPRAEWAEMFGFVDAFRTYVVTYTLGEDFVRGRVASAGEDAEARWEAFRNLNVALVTPVLMGLPPVAYPETRTVDQVDDYHGTSVADTVHVDPPTGEHEIDRASNRVSPSDSVQTRIIEVDGYAVHVYTAGWEHLKRGQPVVVFEGGGFSTLEAWGDLPARLARETAVVAYDRAGRGRSEWDGQRPTLEHVTSRLRRILEVLNAPPPYIHVGHSFGGPLGLAFAREYPDELAGLVLVDPTPPAAAWLGAFDDIGVGRAGYDEFDELFSRAFEGAPESLLIELDVLSGYLSDPEASPWSPPHLSVPVAVLLAGAGYEVPPDLPSTWDLDQQHQALLLRQIANYAEWTRTVPDATMIVANNSRHCIHCWDPELVIGAIRRVLYSDVRVQLRQAMAADGISSIEPTYHALRSRYPDSHFDESRLELLGRELLGFGESEAAIAVFELNAREYPVVVRPHESLGDAYRAAGRLDDARGSYQRAAQLAEANASTRLPALRRKLERVEHEQQRSQSDSSQDNDRK
jgi:pimeloyl-ACP methyl ester carboxylesterase